MPFVDEKISPDFGVPGQTIEQTLSQSFDPFSGLDIDTRKAKALLKTMIKKDLVFLHRDGDYILKEGHGLTADDIKVIEKTIDDSSDAKLTDILKFIVSSNIEQLKRADLSKGK